MEVVELFDPGRGLDEGLLRVALIAPAGMRARLRDVLTAEGHSIVLEAGAAGVVEVGLGEVADVVVIASDGDGEAAANAGIAAVFLGQVEREPEGPHAILEASPADEEVAAAVQAVAAGLTVYAAGMGPLRRPAGAAVEPAYGEEALTPREMEVLSLLALGLPNKAIALELGISEHTAKYHVGAILSKLDAQSRADAVMRAARSGLLAL